MPALLIEHMKPQGVQNHLIKDSNKNDKKLPRKEGNILKQPTLTNVFNSIEI